jgi:hypothetical protein
MWKPDGSAFAAEPVCPGIRQVFGMTEGRLRTWSTGVSKAITDPLL